MMINFLHSRTQHDRSIHISYTYFFIIGIIMGLLISFIFNVFMEDKTNISTSTNAPNQNPIDAMTEQKSTDICQTNTTTQDICSAKNIETLLKLHAIQSLKEEGFFPQTLRIKVEDGFQMEESLPENIYHHSTTVYGVPVSSLEELLSISRIEGIKDIREFTTIQLD